MTEEESRHHPRDRPFDRGEERAENDARYDALAETVAQPSLDAVAPAREDLVRRPEEVFPLWRDRLRLAAVLLFAGFAVFLAWRALQVVLTPAIGAAADWFLFWCHAGVTAILGLFTLLLVSRRSSTYFRLIVAELALFGLPTVLFLASQYFVTLRASEEWGVFAFSGGPWLLLVFVYALFIPSTLRRAMLVIGFVAAAPVFLVLAMFLVEESVARVTPIDQLTGIVLTFAMAGVGGVIGVGKIDRLRREALRAEKLGQYRLTIQLSRGGMGDIFLAEHELLKRPCVIKLIRRDKLGDEQMLARFQREVQTTAGLTHWNTVEILDYGQTEDGTFYYVMEYLPGMSLAELVRKHGPLPPERAVYLLLQVCDALREAHQAGLVHRDIKPENIIITERGGVHDVAKVVDFGLVQPADGRGDAVPTKGGFITGSPLFMSPEQAAGSALPDARADIYSLGAVAYYVVTGRPPFLSDNLVQLVEAHTRDKPAPPSHHNPQVPGDLDRVIEKCLAKDPADRFRDTPQLAHALSRCEAAGGWSRDRASQWWQTREGAA